jgi:hypothetical protein
MPAFTEIDLERIDAYGIVACRGIAPIDERRRFPCLDWLRRNAYEIESVDCSQGLAHAIPELGRMLRWEARFGYTLEPGNRNLDALSDGFNFPLAEHGGKVFELVRPDVAWREDSEWLLGLLTIAMEASLRELALGRRFFTLLVVPKDSPLIGQTIANTQVPYFFWSPCQEFHEFIR